MKKKLDLCQEILPEYKNVQEWASEFGVSCCFCWIPACGATGIMSRGFESAGPEGYVRVWLWWPFDSSLPLCADSLHMAGRTAKFLRRFPFPSIG